MKDNTGHKFGKLTAWWPTGGRIRRSVEWLCLCDCGGLIVASAKALGRTRKSCGCLGANDIPRSDTDARRKRDRERWRRLKLNPVWVAKEKARLEAYHRPDFQGARKLETLETIRERRWRFVQKEILKSRRKAGLAQDDFDFVGSAYNVEHPKLYFVLNGKLQYSETLGFDEQARREEHPNA